MKSNKSNTQELLIVTSILLSGMVQIFMTAFEVSVAGGGASLILVLTTPVIFGLSIISSFIHFILWKKGKAVKVRIFLQLLSYITFISMALISYPYK